MTKFQRNLWLGLVVMALLSPLGIILPERFNSGDAWGEWGADTLHKLLGYVPEGIKKYSSIWKAPIPDYNLGGENAGTGLQIFSYIVSGFIGILATAIIVFAITRFLKKHDR